MTEATLEGIAQTLDSIAGKLGLSTTAAPGRTGPLSIEQATSEAASYGNSVSDGSALCTFTLDFTNKAFTFLRHSPFGSLTWNQPWTGA